MGYPKQPTRARFGETLRALRKSRGLTMADLACKSGLTVVCVSDLERGRCRDFTAVRSYVGSLGGLTSAQMAVYFAAAEMAWSSDEEDRRG